jgi:hypothetical protein
MGSKADSVGSDAALLPKEVGARLRQLRPEVVVTRGRKVFGALRRTRKTRPVWREKAMAKLDKWAAEHELPPEPFIRMKQAVTVLFADMEREGELD